jgi:hypothetical protein
MATIQKRGNTFRVQIRRKGHPPQTRTSESKADAKAWAKRVEGRIDAKDSYDREPKPAKVSMTLGEALKRYNREITPTKRGAKQERSRIKAWLKDPLADKSLSDISRRQLAEWRDKRLSKARLLPPSAMRSPSSLRCTRDCAGTISGRRCRGCLRRGLRPRKSWA